MFAADTKVYREIKDDRQRDTAVRHRCTTGMVQPMASQISSAEMQGNDSHQKSDEDDPRSEGIYPERLRAL